MCKSLMCNSLCRCLLSFLIGKYLGMEWLSHMVGVCSTFSETGKLYHFTFPPAVYESSGCSTSCQHLEWSVLNFSRSNSYVWNLIVVLVSISLIMNDVESISCASWPPVYHLCKVPFQIFHPSLYQSVFLLSCFENSLFCVQILHQIWDMQKCSLSLCLVFSFS